MAAGILAAPGTKYGPCEKDCKHKDCAGTRAMANSVCPECSKPIGYNTRFYILEGGQFKSVYAHANCVEK